MRQKKTNKKEIVSTEYSLNKYTEINSSNIKR